MVFKNITKLLFIGIGGAVLGASNANASTQSKISLEPAAQPVTQPAQGQPVVKKNRKTSRNINKAKSKKRPSSIQTLKNSAARKRSPSVSNARPSQSQKASQPKTSMMPKETTNSLDPNTSLVSKGTQTR